MNPTYYLTTITYLTLHVLSLTHLTHCNSHVTNHGEHTSHQQPQGNPQYSKSHTEPLECEYNAKHRNEINDETQISPSHPHWKPHSSAKKASVDWKTNSVSNKIPPPSHKNSSKVFVKKLKPSPLPMSTKRKPYGRLACGVFDDTTEETEKRRKTTRSLFSGLNITFFNTLQTTKKKKAKQTNMFGYEDYSSITMESLYYDATKDDFNIQDYESYNFTTEFANVKDMYRENKWMRYINRGEARMIETELRDRFGYTIDQIAELSGLSVARAIERHYKKDNYSDVLVMCGSGKNGLYGMVTARHLKLMGYDPAIFLVNEYNSSRQDGHQLFTQLKKQVLAFNIPILSSLPSNASVTTSVHKLIVDAIFGVGYDRNKYAYLPRANRYKYSVNLLREINKMKKKPKTPIVSIDLPSGWDTNIGNYEGHHINPEMLVSLIASQTGGSGILRQTSLRSWQLFTAYFKRKVSSVCTRV
ncbi:hypothetical protein WDU94_000444 [Cyamophila willieti]